MEKFDPDIIHCHQPFLLGDSALRHARMRGIPLVYTNHTLLERYADLLGIDREIAELIAVKLPVAFASLCDLTIAPTPAIGEIMLRRGVESPIDVVPTGIDYEVFASGSRERARERYGFSETDFVVGHAGRLIRAKNVEYLARSVSCFLSRQPEKCRFLLVGDGESLPWLKCYFRDRGVADRVVIAGELGGQELIDAYSAMDLFVFSSRTDTQGLVLVESMAAGVPILALDAPGPHDVVIDGENGRLMPADTPTEDFSSAIEELFKNINRRRCLGEAATARAREYERIRCAEKLLEAYDHASSQPQLEDLSAWDQLLERVKVEWSLIREKADVAAAAFFEAGQAKSAG